MSSRLPPIPAKNVSNKGAGKPARTEAEDTASGNENPEKKGQQGNTKVNTTHQGYQQDR
ncbi:MULTISPECIES: hypothetical protein [Rhizobium]|uniref:hypothetical protein n=1 Tax=Rhizobium TaxID=379 RepID=UPI001B335D67|nr:MULTISPECIES: hypothetical protein [Rhizobium]MBX4909887.1 hypothetical protein [Rhizobium bangladeshense]MBX5217556.1 hypothetical protein [Rhizobium sp. NLR9a]MBX5223649.1 hypothetical protein [Rhizobium sp. NLR8a]MBX5229015.1 hypothetical protein [Rhizobium sp. NLR9b]MBX5235553.1 hypothetical protein [Rhizobium sp. NLR4a]